MKWLTLFLLCAQAKRISSCVFDKVEVEIGAFIYESTVGDVDQCLAWCYEDKSCDGIQHVKVGNECNLMHKDWHPTPKTCTGKAVCYILHRDEVDSACQRYLNF